MYDGPLLKIRAENSVNLDHRHLALDRHCDYRRDDDPWAKGALDERRRGGVWSSRRSLSLLLDAAGGINALGLRSGPKRPREDAGPVQRVITTCFTPSVCGDWRRHPDAVALDESPREEKTAEKWPSRLISFLRDAVGYRAVRRYRPRENGNVDDRSPFAGFATHPQDHKVLRSVITLLGRKACPARGHILPDGGLGPDSFGSNEGGLTCPSQSAKDASPDTTLALGTEQERRERGWLESTSRRHTAGRPSLETENLLQSVEPLEGEEMWDRGLSALLARSAGFLLVSQPKNASSTRSGGPGSRGPGGELVRRSANATIREGGGLARPLQRDVALRGIVLTDGLTRGG